MSEMKGLIIDTPAIDKILSGKKIWEMRATHTKVRGVIALIRKGSGTVVGVVELCDSRGPFTPAEMQSNQHYHQISNDRLADPRVAKWNHAWVLKGVKLFSKPISYTHPNGAVIWVNLDASTSQEIKRSANS